jgi:hypothetical protein
MALFRSLPGFHALSLARLLNIGGPFGWGLITASDAPREIEEALAPLIEKRREQMRGQVHVFSGADGLQPDESAQEFLARHGATLQGGVNESVPRFLLIVGHPDAIPFRVQTDLAMGRFVGRIAFDRVEDYARYAGNVVRAEGMSEPSWLESALRIRLDIRPSLAGMRTPSALLTVVSTAQPPAPSEGRDPNGWTSRLVSGALAAVRRLPQRKAALVDGLLANKDGIAAAFTAPDASPLVLVVAPGLELPADAPQQRASQGAFVCGKLPESPDSLSDHIFAAQDIGESADLEGRIIVAAGSFSAGTPSIDAFALYALRQMATHTETPFVAALPKRVMSLERGALAWIGHGDRVWGYLGDGKEADLSGPNLYAAFIAYLIAGGPVGLAARAFALRAAKLAVRLEELEDEIDSRGSAAARDIAEAWMAYRDAASLIVLGDPLVHLPRVAAMGRSLWM